MRTAVLITAAIGAVVIAYSVHGDGSPSGYSTGTIARNYAASVEAAASVRAFLDPVVIASVPSRATAECRHVAMDAWRRAATARNRHADVEHYIAWIAREMERRGESPSSILAWRMAILSTGLAPNEVVAEDRARTVCSPFALGLT